MGTLEHPWNVETCFVRRLVLCRLDSERIDSPVVLHVYHSVPKQIFKMYINIE